MCATERASLTAPPKRLTARWASLTRALPLLQAVYEQLIQSGYTEEQASAFLQIPEGQVAVAQAAAALTDGQKAQILNAAVAGLTDEQKEQILEGAAASLTDEQKAQIKQGYI